MDWKLLILERLRIRNQKEGGGFIELISSHTKLQDQVESLKREITRLDYQKDELEKELEGDGGTGSAPNAQGDGSSSKEVARYKKKVEDLTSKLMIKKEELMDRQSKWIEVAENFRKKEDEMKIKDNIIKTLENENGIFKKQNSDLKEKSQKLESSYLLLKDECIANVAASNSNEQKLKKMSQENDELDKVVGKDHQRKRLIQIRAQQADELNEANETFQRQRDKKLEDDIRRASEEKEPFCGGGAEGGGLGKKEGGRRISTKSREGSDKRTRTGSGPEVGGVADVMGPSICPTTPFSTFDAHDSEVSALCFSSDGQYMATGGADKLVKVWSWRPSQDKMELKFTLRGCSQSIMSVQFDQSCRQVLAASNDCGARIWTLHDERLKHTLTGHGNRVMSAKFLEDNMKVVTGSHDRTLKIWDLQHKAYRNVSAGEVDEYVGHYGGLSRDLRDCKLSSCTKTLFAGSSCNDVVAGRGLGTTVISGHFDRRIRFWDTRTATANEIALQGKVTSLDHFPDKHWLLCCSRDDALRLIDLRQNSIMTTFNANGFRVGVDWTRACFSPDGQYVAAGSSDGSLFIWETYSSNSKPKREKCKEHIKDVVVVGWHPSGQLFATADRNKKATLWKR